MTPAMKTINGKQCVRLIDLAHAWDTTTSNILAASKPHHIPGKYLHRIDGRIWCELEGLRYRSTATSKSRLTRHIMEFLDSLGKPTEPEPKTEPAATDLDTTIADARRTAYQALAKAEENATLINETDDAAWEARRTADGNRGSIGSLLARMDRVSAELQGNTNLIGEYSQRFDKLENTVEKLKPCRDHVARHQSASATVVSDKNTGRINDLTTRVHDLDVRVKALEHDVPQLLHAMCPKERVQELSGKLGALMGAVHGNQNKTTDNAAAIHVAKDMAGKALDTATQAADLAQKNADLANENKTIVGREIERLTKQKERIDALEKHNTVVEALLAISILVGTVGIGGVVGCLMK